MTLRWKVLLASLFLMSVSGWAAARSTPTPAKVLFSPENTLVAARVVDVGDDGSLQFQVTETLSGKAGDSTVLARTTSAWLAEVSKGQKVIVGFTLYRRSQQQSKSIELRPDGPVILASAGLEPALFADTSETRALIDSARAATKRGESPALSTLIEGLASKDRQVQNFQATELVLRTSLHSKLSARDRARIEAFAARAASHPSARAALMLAALAEPGFFGADWPSRVALDVIAGSPVRAASEESGFNAYLVRVSFDVLARSGSDVPLSAARRWLASTQPGLVESALLAIRRSAPDEERGAAEQALAGRDLAPASREFLRDHLRRLDIMQRSLEAAHPVEGRKTQG